MDCTIDGSKIESPSELHEALVLGLGLRDYYGRNLDALWDCLTGWVQPPLTVIWKDYAEVETEEFDLDAYRDMFSDWGWAARC